ncbi:transcription factor DIVARICATA-like [Heracleum sosnowskyi]|uniref:Transcription factor DIVARICATA-like n=1 Tax=Heracleum sosnowskyi TaxID=360622 RepID=A0AAD8GXC2_9APIA|nr:transcription factor DIVARICATA-like [Heracleum sosnowskyi]KAK1355707.1 transcription factor DIVARICATA-like [Heracleum sosnowskyi]KAK1355708.1 transcription factor DIVARICATA-like [Heracleum sosnowskyi]
MEGLYSNLSQHPNENDVYTIDGWTFKDNKLYEKIMEDFEHDGSVAFFQRVALVMPWKTIASIKLHHQILLEDLNWIKSSTGEFEDIIMDDNGDFEDFGVEDTIADEEQVKEQTSRPKKKGIPWTKEEHRSFVLGLEICGKGDWKNISRYFVTSRTPTQVASHAQKFMKRQLKTAAEKLRTTINDIQCFCCDSSPCMFGSSGSLA